MDPTPLYHRVYLLLLQAISDRTFPPDQPMPGEFELSVTMGISRVTLRAALKRLEQEGLIQRHRGRGTYPMPDRLATLTAMPGIRDQVSLALKTDVRILDHAMVPASAAVAAALHLAPGTEVLQIVRLRFDQTSPISHSTCYIPAHVAAFLPPDRIMSLPISTLLASAGLALDRFREQIGACIANSPVATALEIDVGSPLLSMDRTVSLAEDQVVQQLRVLYRPDRYNYRIEYAAHERSGAADVPWTARMAEGAREEGASAE